jgi:hypothetical protein
MERRCCESGSELYRRLKGVVQKYEKKLQELDEGEGEIFYFRDK